MKLQKLLLNPATSGINQDIETINDLEKQIIDLISKRQIREQNIAGDIICLIQKDEQYPDFKSILQMNVIKGEEKTSLLITICMKIGESVAAYRDKEQDHPNGFINWGAVFCDVAQEEVKEAFGSFDVTIFDNKLKSLNNFLAQYDITLEWMNAPSDKMRFVAKIFPDK